MMKLRVEVVVLLSILVGTAAAAQSVSFNRHVIHIPGDRSRESWYADIVRDLDRDGKTDLLAVSPTEVFVFRQTASGFSTQPDQRFEFPEGTAWFAIADIIEGPDLEILISTGNGVAYYRQEKGVFEMEPSTLITAEQVFAQKSVGPADLIGTTRVLGDGTLKAGIPVIFSDHVVTYEPDGERRYRPGPRTELELETSMWQRSWRSWSLGGKESSNITTWVRHMSKRSGSDEEEEQHPYIAGLLEKIEKKGDSEHAVEKKDINSDGKEDLSFWHVPVEFDPTTTLVIFLRREDGSLPDKPDQAIRCRGIPANWVSERRQFFSPFIDIDNDGFLDIVFIEPRNLSMSVRSLLEMVTSEGMDWRFTVRFFEPGQGFPRRADYKKDLTGILPILEQWESMINLDGDFNGDGRPDLMIRRNPTLIEIYFSSPGGDLYSRNPRLRMTVPAKGWTTVNDFNKDSISDIVIHVEPHEEGDITLFLSERSTERGAVR
jgi:hypothetical protein